MKILMMIIWRFILIYNLVGLIIAFSKENYDAAMTSAIMMLIAELYIKIEKLDI